MFRIYGMRKQSGGYKFTAIPDLADLYSGVFTISVYGIRGTTGIPIIDNGIPDEIPTFLVAWWASSYVIKARQSR
jgi:hypothetical protein